MAAFEFEHDAPNGAINVTTEQIRPLLLMAKNAKVDVAALLAAAGLPLDFEDLAAGSPAPLRAYFRLMHEISIALADETLQLSPRQHLPGTMDFVLSHLQSANSLYDSMKAVASYYNLLHAGDYNSVRRAGDYVTVVIDDRKFPYTSSDREYVAFSMECVEIFVHGMLSTIAPKVADEALQSVSVTRARENIPTAHLSFWSVPVRYSGAVYTLAYDASIALAPLPLPRAYLPSADRVYARVDEMIRARESEPTTRRRAAGAVRDYLRQGVVDQGRIAELMDVSVATLRRRLAEEGATFRELRKDELNGAAQRLLKKRRPIADVAEELGFSEFRSFNRAFKEWNGLTPKAFVDRLDRRS